MFVFRRNCGVQHSTKFPFKLFTETAPGLNLVHHTPDFRTEHSAPSILDSGGPRTLGG